MSLRKAMSARERLDAVFSGESPDRTPVLGGWIACPEHICELAGVNLETYWADPAAVSIAAYHELGTDGLVGIFVPRGRDDFRCVDRDTYKRADIGLSLEEAVAQIDAMPTAAEIEKDFDFHAEYENFRAGLIEMQQRCGDIVWMPAQWGAGAKVTWYDRFGYETFFCIVGLYPRRARTLMEIGGAWGWRQGRLVAAAVQEGIYPRACFLGEDICTQRGPMISPEFLAEHWAPALRHGLSPLLEAGCKPVWHCDGDVRPLLGVLLDCGVQGLQGFQGECGMTIDYVAALRTRDRRPLLIFGPLSVTTELPVCTPEQIKAKVRRAIDVCRGNAHLAIFTANTINPDVPLANIRAMHEAVRE